MEKKYDEMETKYNEINDKYNEVEKKFNEVNNSNLKLKNEIRQNQVKLERERNDMEEIEKLKSDKTKLEKEKNDIMQERDLLRKEKMEMEKKYNNVNENNIKLNEECKELQIELRDLKSKYNELKRMNIDESKFMEWDSDVIVDWIVGLNEEYKQYEKVMRVNMKKEDLDGSILEDLDKNDLHRFGVVSIKHKVGIIKQIKRICNAGGKHVSHVQNNNNVIPPAVYSQELEGTHILVTKK